MFLIDTCLCPLILRDEHETPALFEKSNMTFDELLRTRKETENWIKVTVFAREELITLENIYKQLYSNKGL